MIQAANVALPELRHQRVGAPVRGCLEFVASSWRNVTTAQANECRERVPALSIRWGSEAKLESNGEKIYIRFTRRIFIAYRLESLPLGPNPKTFREVVPGSEAEGEIRPIFAN